MEREHAAKKEIALLLRRHNKIAKVKLANAELDIPNNILDILCQKVARNTEQIETVESFRQKELEHLLSISKQIHIERVEKAKKTREQNLENDPRYVKHFGIWIDITKNNAKISREHYAIIDRRSTFISPIYAKWKAENGDSRYILDDTGEYGIYSEEWCLSHQQLCLKNYDVNMARFSTLDSEEFENVLNRFVKKRKFKEIYDLDAPICNSSSLHSNIIGYVYIMVLDTYKQAYIGITQNNVKKRIMQHWKNKRAFDRLIFGSVEGSVISIDSFGPLDTSRIFVLPYSADRKTILEDYEYNCIKAFDGHFLLNRLR